MSAATGCDCNCPTPDIVNIPGGPGDDGDPGDAGTNGINAYTVTSANVTLPGVAGPIIGVISVGVSSWMAIGQTILISDGTRLAHVRVDTIPGATSITGTWLDYAGDSAGGSVLTSGAAVVPSGTQPVLAAPLPTALTDNSTGAQSNTIAAGAGVSTLMFFFDLSTLTTLARELMTNYVPGYAFKILSVDLVVVKEGTGAGASQTINLEINTTNLTGGVINPTLANTNVAGALVAGTAVTANNTGSASDTLSIEVAAGGVIFTAGHAIILIRIQNMDTANAVASLAKHVNDLITSLT